MLILDIDFTCNRLIYLSKPYLLRRQLYPIHCVDQHCKKYKYLKCFDTINLMNCIS